jgi:hypothetical protein
VLAAKGFFPADLLNGFARFDSPLGQHPDRTLVPGVEISSPACPARRGGAHLRELVHQVGDCPCRAGLQACPRDAQGQRQPAEQTDQLSDGRGFPAGPFRTDYMPRMSSAAVSPSSGPSVTRYSTSSPARRGRLVTSTRLAAPDGSSGRACSTPTASSISTSPRSPGPRGGFVSTKQHRKEGMYGYCRP